MGGVRVVVALQAPASFQRLDGETLSFGEFALQVEVSRDCDQARGGQHVGIA
jgi:hypothetical protein